MIFEALKLLHVCNKNNLMVEELFILQTIYDYQTNVSELKRDYVKELEKNYLEYYSKFSGKYDIGGMYEKDISWKNYIEKLIRDGWIEDFRRNKNSFKLSELRVSDNLFNFFKLNFTKVNLCWVNYTPYIGRNIVISKYFSTYIQRSILI